MNKVVLIAIAVVVIAGAFLLIGSNKTENGTMATPTPEPQATITQIPEVTPEEGMMKPEKIVTVNATSSGFVPQSITVKPGTLVVWKNMSGTMVTVNSAPHPTHSLYPFLNLGQFADGASVQVTFGKPGTYNYHNHLNSSQTGTVVVEQN